MQDDGYPMMLTADDHELIEKALHGAYDRAETDAEKEAYRALAMKFMRQLEGEIQTELSERS